MEVANIIPNVLFQHADAAAALAQDRFYAQKSAKYNLSDLMKLESRLDGHLDGLLISGREGWLHYQEHLIANEYGEVFVQTFLAIRSKRSDQLDIIFKIVEDDAVLMNAVVDAFVWLEYEEVSSLLDLLYKTGNVQKQFIVIGTFAGHRQINLDYFKDALCSSNVQLRQRALIAVAELGEQRLSSLLLENLDHPDRRVQFAASWSLTRFGNAKAMQCLTTFLTDADYCEAAIQFVVLQKDTHRTVDILRELFKSKETQRLSIFAMGLLGNPKSIEPLIALMSDPDLARVAGEAFSFITGVDLEFEDLNQDEPEGVNVGPNDDPKNDDVAMDQDEDLSWPNPSLVAVWWQKNMSRFPSDKKFVLGKEASVTQYKAVLTAGTQNQRMFAALVIAVQQKQQAIFNVTAPALRQKNSLLFE